MGYMKHGQWTDLQIMLTPPNIRLSSFMLLGGGGASYGSNRETTTARYILMLEQNSMCVYVLHIQAQVCDMDAQPWELG